MIRATDISSVAPTGFDWGSDTGVAAEIRRVMAAATDADGATPLDEAAILELRRHGLGGSTMWVAPSGFAWLHDGAVDLVVDPEARGRGVGRALATTVLASVDGPLLAWSHGNHPAAAALASDLGFDRIRDLWVMRRELSSLPPLGTYADGIEVRPFRVGEDEDAFLAVNAEAFAHHPEQGGMTREALDARLEEPWFDPDGFFLAERGGELIGFHWTKVHDERPPHGEVYVVGVSPRAQGGGLGKRLTLTGLHHLAGLGLAEVLLYVEADNTPAIAVYERLGFTHAPEDTHVQYAFRPEQP